MDHHVEHPHPDEALEVTASLEPSEVFEFPLKATDLLDHPLDNRVIAPDDDGHHDVHHHPGSVHHTVDPVLGLSSKHDPLEMPGEVDVSAFLPQKKQRRDVTLSADEILGGNADTSFFPPALGCSLCDDTFPNYTMYKVHMANAHSQVQLATRDNSLWAHTCVQCDKTFDTQSRLMRHVSMVHEGKRDYKCEEPGCDRHFFQKSQLLRHHRTVHELRRDFVCPECPKQFSEKGNLVVHIKTVHKGIREFPCDQCHRSFGQVSTLRAHVAATHHKRKAFECEQCGNSFAQRSTLYSHVRVVHEGRRDFVCATCGKAFGQKGALNRHVRAAHFALKCDMCDLRFRTRSELLDHQMKDHPPPTTAPPTGGLFPPVEIESLGLLPNPS